mgnify:CR=1 FL=1
MSGIGVAVESGDLVVVGRMVKRKSIFRVGMSNSMVAGMDLRDSESLTTVLSPTGDVVDRFSFAMNEEGTPPTVKQSLRRLNR